MGDRKQIGLVNSEAGEPKRNAFLAWLVAEVRWVFRVFYSASDRFYWDNGFSKASSLAYTSLVSLVPLIALCSGILASFAVTGEYLPAVREFLFKQFVPNAEVVDQVLRYLAEFSEALASLNALVMGVLVITSLLLVNSVEYVLNYTWQVFEPRPIANRIAIFSSIILIAPVLFLSSFYFIKFRLEPFLIDIGVGSFLATTYHILLPFVIDSVAFLLLYYLVPKAPVKFGSAVFGAFFAALFFNIAKSWFAFYLAEYASYDKIYKTLAAIPISLFWLYLAWVIVLFGVELCYQAQYLPRSGKVWKRSILSVGDARLLLAFQSLVMIARAFTKGHKMPNDLELAETLECSSVVLKPALDALERAGILVRGDSRDMPLSLLRHPSTITLEEVREVLFRGSDSGHFAREMEKLFGALRSEADLSHITLADIMQDNNVQPLTQVK